MGHSKQTTTSAQGQAQDDFQTHKMTSKNGHEYDTGSKSAEKASNGSATATTNTSVKSASDAPVVAHGAPFTVNVNWQVDNQWHTPPQDFQDTTGITSYILGNSSNIIYDYYIQITTNQNYDYYFTDASPDTYELNVNDTSSDHIVRYNSSAPNIQYITGK